MDSGNMSPWTLNLEPKWGQTVNPSLLPHILRKFLLEEWNGMTSASLSFSIGLRYIIDEDTKPQLKSFISTILDAFLEEKLITEDRVGGDNDEPRYYVNNRSTLHWNHRIYQLMKAKSAEKKLLSEYMMDKDARLIDGLHYIYKISQTSLLSSGSLFENVSLTSDNDSLSMMTKDSSDQDALTFAEAALLLEPNTTTSRPKGRCGQCEVMSKKNHSNIGQPPRTNLGTFISSMFSSIKKTVARSMTNFGVRLVVTKRQMSARAQKARKMAGKRSLRALDVARAAINGPMDKLEMKLAKSIIKINLKEKAKPENCSNEE